VTAGRLTWTAIGAALLTAAAASAGTAARTQSLTLYANAVRVQFVDHSDDRARGTTKNPFNADVDALLPKSKALQKGGGPYPGDTATYSFKLFRDPGLTKSVGTAEYSCTFAFNKKAFCTANYYLKSGAILASGPADFTSPRFQLALTGGTNTYLGASGQVASAPAGDNAHRLNFTIFG
jgi:hypothetical protein